MEKKIKSCKIVKENRYMFLEKIKNFKSFFIENFLDQNGSLYMNYNLFYCFSLKIQKTKCW